MSETTLTEAEWLVVRKAALQWADQVVNEAMPGPEPLLGVLNELLAARLAAADRDTALRERWEREVLEKFLQRIPGTGEAPDYLHALATAMQDTRAALDAGDQP